MFYLKIFFVSIVFISCGNRLSDERERPDLRTPERAERPASPPRQQGTDYCYNFSTCRNVCSSVYEHPAEIGRCLDLSVDEVEDIYTVAFRLQQPMSRDLRRINEDNFKSFISVGTETLNRYIFNYTIPEAKRILALAGRGKGCFENTFYLRSG